MEKGAGSGLFVNDGSFMEKFKQLQQEQQQKGAAVDGPRSDSSTPLKPALVPTNKRPLDAVKSNDSKKSATAPSSASNGKLAFSFKKKSKIAVAPVKLGADEEEEEEGGGEQQGGVSDDSSKRQRLAPVEAPKMSQKGDVAPSAPSNPEVKKVADKLASFVAKNGRQFENVTRQKNPGDTPFKFLFDPSCSDYKYYEHRLMEEEKALVQSKDSQLHANVSPLTPRSSTGSRKGPLEKQSNYQTPASALYGISEETSSSERIPSHGESSRPSASDPIAMMEFYMKKAAQEERKRQPRQSKDEMPPPSSLQASNKKGHHMGDYIPQEELEKFLSTCNDAAAQKAAREYADRNKIQADNVGHKLLSKMGWKEGEGLGSSKSGRADPVMAGNVKIDNLGVGAQKPGEVTADDDIYEQYKKRMMLGYRYRPNPLNNPRKAYY